MSTDTFGRDESALATQLAQLVGAWWFNYDEWNVEILRGLITDDIAFSSRTDSGETDYEDFVRANLVGADDVMAWQEEHRMNSPYPLRHNGSNLHITGMDGGKAEFASYIFVTKIADGRPLSLSTGTACGTAQITERGLLLRRLDVVLDTTDSVALVS
ncbi:hypothetical protein [Rhodococcus jostii]|uniref:hypothetical protein n=1 Tax=Rhodococcus jostii TaxID=132919 RepID=UPI00030F00E3|nr:hypothetical protein [Rhodococcus jostii]